MLLTEAVRIVGLMSGAICDTTATAPDTDPLLRAVCRWRIDTPVQYADLEDVTGLGRPCQFRRMRATIDHESAAHCLRSALLQRGTTWAPVDLMARCQTSAVNVTTTIHRLRAEGHDVRWMDGGPRGVQASGYRVIHPKTGRRVA